MSLFDSIGGQRQMPNWKQVPGNPRQFQNPQQMDPRFAAQQQAMQQDVAQIKAGPVAFLKQRGYNVPDGMTDAKEITQYLLQSGQVGQSRLQQVVGMLGRR